MKLVLLGAPGSGKGTLAAGLVENLKIPSISTGDLLRNAIKEGTKEGLQAKTYMDEGKLVPTTIVLEMLKKRLNEKDTKNGYILDGFPRTIEQAELLDKMVKIDTCLYLDVDKDVIVKRIGGRITCCKCGKVANVAWKGVGKTCDCGGEWYTRDDDNPATVAKRFDTFTEQTKPLIEYYQNKKILKTLKCPEDKDETLKMALEMLK